MRKPSTASSLVTLESAIVLMVAGAVYADVANSCRILVWLDFVPFVACLNPRFLVNYAQ